MALDPWLENLRKITLKNPGVLVKSSLPIGIETILFLVFLPFCKNIQTHRTKNNAFCKNVSCYLKIN